MRIEIKNRKFYAHFPNRLYIELLELDKLHEEINLDLAAFILHLIIKPQSEPEEWTPLSSEILKKYNHGIYKSNRHIELLRKEGIIEYKKHVHNIKGKKNSSRRYRVSPKYFGNFKENVPAKKNFKVYEISNPILLKRVQKHNKLRRIEASSSTNHLTKWLDNRYYTIDQQQALDLIQKKYRDKPKKYLNRSAIINNFNPSENYSRNGKDDRLHSLLTRLPRDLKQFVKFNGNQLVETDIKSSQPTMFALLLDKILGHYHDLLNTRYGVTDKRLKNRIYKTLKDHINNYKYDYYKESNYVIDINEISYRITIILQNTLKTPDFTDIYNFISLVKSGYIYESLGNYLLSEGAIWTEDKMFYTILWTKKKKQEICSFKSKRKCSKKVLLNALYSRSGKGSVNVINKVKQHFSTIFQIAEAFKAVKYEDFSLLLQRMEAKFILDFCSKNIANKFPEMPLITRHDSISTTVEWADLLYIEFQSQSYNYFETEIKSDKKFW